MMRCTQCGKMTRMNQIRFVPDGRVSGVVNMKKHNAVCSKCLLSDVASNPQQKEEQAAVVTETVENEFPF